MSLCTATTSTGDALPPTIYLPELSQDVLEVSVPGQHLIFVTIEALISGPSLRFVLAIVCVLLLARVLVLSLVLVQHFRLRLM